MFSIIKRLRWYMHSIQFQLSAGVLSVLLVLGILILYNNKYTVIGMRNQVAATEKTMISLYLKQIDSQLEEIDRYIIDLALNNSDLSICRFYKEGNTRTLALARLMNDMKSTCMAYEWANTIFVYFENNGSYISATAGDMQNNKLRDEFLNHIETFYNQDGKSFNFNQKGWSVLYIEDSYYLIHMLKTDDLCVGAWVNAEELLIPLDESKYGVSTSTTFFIDSDYNIMSSSEQIQALDIDLRGNLDSELITTEDERYITVNEKSVKGDFTFVSVTPEKKVAVYYPFINHIYTIVILGIGIFIVFYTLLLRKVIIIPLNRILVSMRQIRSGKWGTRVIESRSSNEFEMVNSTFNQMMMNMKDLKISIYEEKIKKQKAEHEQLKLQINPHFFINAIGIINRLALEQKFEIIQEMSMCLIGYFRYILRYGQDFVTIREEVQHNMNYLRIQQLRVPDCFEYTIDLPEELNDIPVPPLIIHNFIENSIKYALSDDVKVSITVKAELIKSEGEQALNLTISDTGPGFRGDVLQKLRAGEIVIDNYGGEHIGIWNLKHRLKHLYNGKAQILFYNDEPSGAVVSIMLPL